jgi:hypothetical protein
MATHVKFNRMNIERAAPLVREDRIGRAASRLDAEIDG